MPSSLTAVPAATATAPTFNEKFAAERLAGAKTFSYDRDGDGTMESYTTQTVEEASPAGSNSLYQSFVNLITPGDDKEYQGGKIVNTGSGKTTVKKKNNSAKNAIARLKNSNGGINVNTTDTAILGKVSNDGNWQEVVQPGTNAITRTNGLGVIMITTIATITQTKDRFLVAVAQIMLETLER